MPRRVIRSPGLDRNRSLGWLATWWMETFTVHGPGPIVGHAVRLTDEYTEFVVDAYALDEHGRRLHDSGFLSRPKGCDKSGLGAKLALFEAFGPCRFAGWANGGETYELLGRTYVYRRGEPMGRKLDAPFVRVLATEEEQTGNVYATILHNLTSSTAPLYGLRAYGVEAGKSEIAIPGGGVIKKSTAGAKSKDGGLETFAVFDETHLYVTPQLREMYATVRGNVVTKRRIDEPWYLETTTMFGPGDESVAESTYEYADKIQQGVAKVARLLFDHRWGIVEDLADEEALRAALADAYGDALAWNPLDDLVNAAYDIRQPEEWTRRYSLNALTSSKGAWLSPVVVESRGITRVRAEAEKAGGEFDWHKQELGDVITLGFDGALTQDATALIAVRVTDLFAFPIRIEEIPDGPEAEGWEVDREAFDTAVFRAFEKYTVVGFYADPPHWQDYVDGWNREFGSTLKVHAQAKNSIGWWTKRDVEMADALERVKIAFLTGELTFDDETPFGQMLKRHLINARVWHRRGGDVIGKEGKNSPKKIDAAVALALAFKAAADYRAGKKPEERRAFVPFRVH